MGRKPVSLETRQQIIGLSKDETNSNVKIAKLVGVSEKCVRTTLANFKNFGSPIESPRPGRPKATTPRDEKWICRQARVNPKISYRNLADEFNSWSSEGTVSKDTVRKILKSSGINSYIATRKPLLSIKDRLKRRRWCKERLHWTVEDWANVIFSDESNFEVINRKSRIFVTRLRCEKYEPRFCTPCVQGGGGSAGIWGCISHKGTGVSNIYTGRINQYTYKNTLENCLFTKC